MIGNEVEPECKSFDPLLPIKQTELNFKKLIFEYQKMRNEAQIEKNSCFYYKLVSG